MSDCLLPSEGLPTSDRHIDVARVEFDGEQTRLMVSAAIKVVPLPENGSYTASPGMEMFWIGRRMHSKGF